MAQQKLSQVSRTLNFTSIKNTTRNSFSKAYTDNEYVNLKGSLTQALINCGGCAYQGTTRIIKELQPSIEEDEDNFVYCNYILNGIETERKRVVDKVYHFKAVKKLLNENASI